MKQRRTDGTFGTDSEIAPVTAPTRGRGPGKRFAPGTPKPANSGRKKGVTNKLTAELAEVTAEMPKDGEEKPATQSPDGRPRDPLLCLEWAMMHPKASLGLIVMAADKLASYKYAKKIHNQHDVSEELREVAARLVKGRERVANGKKKPE
jgi:hypothetical protein